MDRPNVPAPMMRMSDLVDCEGGDDGLDILRWWDGKVRRE